MSGNLFNCSKCGSKTRMNVLAGISAPSELSHQFSKSNLRQKEVWLTHVNWETADYICTNPLCCHITNGYGNYVTGLEKRIQQLTTLSQAVLDNSFTENYIRIVTHDSYDALADFLKETDNEI